MRPALFACALIVSVMVGAGGAGAQIAIGVAAPLSGPVAWAGEQMDLGVETAVADLNAAGGVLGRQVHIVAADDYCDGEQAVAVARKLVAERVALVAGHLCSGASIPASKIYADAGILMISPGSTSRNLTEQGLGNVFRVIGRDDLQGRIAGDLLADRWAGRPIAILHDGETYGKGLAEEAKKQLNTRGVTEAIFEAIEPGRPDYADVVERLERAGIEVLYYGGYMQEAALILREAAERGHPLQLVAGEGIGNEDFDLIAGAAADGTLVTFPTYPPLQDPRLAALAAGSVNPLALVTGYTAVQAWAQAVEAAGSLDTDAVAQELRSQQFDTLLGTIGFDQKGDLTGDGNVAWHVWQNGRFALVVTE